MFGFGNTSGTPAGSYQMAGQAPWANLPTAQAPWTTGGASWAPGQQAPWRLSPWQTQGMPSGAPVGAFQQPTQPIPQLDASTYLPQGTSDQISNFNPTVPGGGMAPVPAATAPQAQAPAQSSADGIWHQGMYYGTSRPNAVDPRKFEDTPQYALDAAKGNPMMLGLALGRNVNDWLNAW